VYNNSTMKRTHSIRVPVTLAEMRAAQQLAERADMPLALLIRKMLRDAAGEAREKPKGVR
jgi:hypothetical protein